MLFATGLSDADSSAVTVQLEDSQHHIYPLVVESLSKVPNFDSLTQLVVKLPDSIATEGDFQLTLTFHGVTSNKPLISIVR